MLLAVSRFKKKLVFFKEKGSGVTEVIRCCLMLILFCECDCFRVYMTLSMMSIQVAGLFTCKLIHAWFPNTLGAGDGNFELITNIFICSYVFELCTQVPREWAVIISTMTSWFCDYRVEMGACSHGLAAD